MNQQYRKELRELEKQVKAAYRQEKKDLGACERMQAVCRTAIKKLDVKKAMIAGRANKAGGKIAKRIAILEGRLS